MLLVRYSHAAQDGALSDINQSKNSCDRPTWLPLFASAVSLPLEF